MYEVLVDRIDWTPFFHLLGFKGKYPELLQQNEEAQKTYKSALEVLHHAIQNQEFKASILLKFFKAHSEEEDIILENGHRLPMFRQ